MSLHPHFNLKYALEGRIVPMDGTPVLPRARIFVKDGIIMDIRKTNEGYPIGFSSNDVIKSGGTIYPGMMELHNHLPYNILPYWISERRFDNHTQWKRIKGYKINVQGPMQTLGKTPQFPQAIVKYVECKCLVGGVTTSQGVTLANSNLRKRFFHGATRNVEETNEAILPEVKTRIADLGAGDARTFKSRLSEVKTTLLHLSEGVDDRARSFFTNLKVRADNWAISNKLCGIHCTGLKREDFRVLSEKMGSMTWSPFSNLLLYGDTADIQAAKDFGILMALGSDWSPSGSKNLLEELKVAKLVSDHLGGVFTDEELVEMVTINPARILGWEDSLGSISVGKKADFIVVNGYTGDPFLKLIEATEKNIYGVFINGVLRYGLSRIMDLFLSSHEFHLPDIEEVVFDGTTRKFYFKEADPDNFLQNITYRDAAELLKGGLLNIGQHALDLENSSANGFVNATDNPLDINWFLMPDFHDDQLDASQGDFEWGASVKYSEIAVPLPLDGLTVVDDDEHFSRLQAQPNLPDYIREHLPRYYDRPPLGNLSHSFLPSDHIHHSLNLAVTLETFKKRSSNLSTSEKLLILRQARLLINNFYVHRILKRSMYAVNPEDRLERMINSIQYHLSNQYNGDDRFHQELLSIFSSLRDLHTRYYLPAPYRNRFAFLPFLIEECYESQEDEVAKFIVTKTFDTIRHKGPFGVGVEVISWNHIPMEKVIELNAQNQSGSNEDARRVRSVDTLTIRALGSTIAPYENAVTLKYRTKEGKEYDATYEWMVAYYPPHFSLDPEEELTNSMAYGCDVDTLHVNNVKLGFYVTGGESGKPRPKPSKWIWPPKNHSMRGRKIKDVGYIRIFSFTATSAEAFVEDFNHILVALKKKNIKGLIIDVRGNGGGLITAAELLLAKLSGAKFNPQQFQFLSSGMTLELTGRHTDTAGLVNLIPWNHSLINSKSTGEIYSLGAPISQFNPRKKHRRIFTKKMILITDALCYSATDMFAAGFQDLGIGKILGIHGNTGAGGANVWSYAVLQALWRHGLDSDPQFESLPSGANITIAIRRTLRASGYPLEDIGVVPDVLHKMTEQDLLNGNIDLIQKAMEVLGV